MVILFSVFAIYWVDNKEKAISISGLVFQLCGFSIAMIDISSLKKKFSIPTLGERAVRWVKDKPPLRVPEQIVQVDVAKMKINANSISVRSEDNIGLDIESKLEVLEKRINMVESSSGERILKLQNNITSKIEKLDRQFCKIDSEQSMLSHLMKMLFVEDIFSAEVAVISFVVGSVMSTLPSEILKLYRFVANFCVA